MNFKDVFEIIHDLIYKIIDSKEIEINENSRLIGSDALLDSMGLVELCVNLEDRASDMGFEFDWTSESAMSRTSSIFGTAGSLASEFFRQMQSPR